MSFQHRNLAHRVAHPRQIPGPGGGRGPGNDGPPGGGPPGPGSSSASAQPSETDDPFTNGPVFTKASSTTAPPPSPPPTQSARPTTSSQVPPTTTSTQIQPTATLTTSSSTSSSTSLSSSTTSILSTTAPINTLTVPGRVATSSFATLSVTSIAGGFPTESASPSASPDPTSGVKVGTVVGAIAGVLVGIGILGLLVSFILRRLRKRGRRDTIIGDEFRHPEFTVDNDGPLEPPNMTQRHHSFTPSVASGPGMAGYGAFQGATLYDNGVPEDAAGYGATANSAPLRERPKYTYGQGQGGGEDDASEIAHGVYSSQPQPQVSYNPEAYGSYATYEGDPNAAAGYQNATRQYQGQPSYAQGGYDAQYAQYDTYVVADPGSSATTDNAPAVGSSTAGAHPIARNPTSTAGNRGPNTRSVVQDDDVYGGI